MIPVVQRTTPLYVSPLRVRDNGRVRDARSGDEIETRSGTVYRIGEHGELRRISKPVSLARQRRAQRAAERKRANEVNS